MYATSSPRSRDLRQAPGHDLGNLKGMISGKHLVMAVISGK
jgi:hypothetical protein